MFGITLFERAAAKPLCSQSVQPHGKVRSADSLRVPLWTTTLFEAGCGTRCQMSNFTRQPML